MKILRAPGGGCVVCREWGKEKIPREGKPGGGASKKGRGGLTFAIGSDIINSLYAMHRPANLGIWFPVSAGMMHSMG